MNCRWRTEGLSTQDDLRVPAADAVSGIRSQACAFPLNPSTRTSKAPICFTITNTYFRKTVITESRKNRNLFFRITASKVFVLQNPSMTPCATSLRNNFAQAPKSRRDLTTWWGMV